MAMKPAADTKSEAQHTPGQSAAQQISTYNIVRRAYGHREVAEQFVGTWVNATLHSMQIERAKRDGEYFVFPVGEDFSWKPGSSYQSGMDWL